MPAILPGLQQIDPATLAVASLLALFLAALELAIVGGSLYLFYWILTLPMRRNERARLFLDLLALGIGNGQTPEQSIVEAAAAKDPAGGRRFQRIASEIRRGLKLSGALDRVRYLVPAQVTAMIRNGERIGDVSKVLPACRHLLHDGVSQVRGALNYLLLLTFLVTPATVIVPMLLAVFVLPRFKEVFHGIHGGALPAFTTFVFSHAKTLMLFQAIVLVVIWLMMIGYIGGPRIRRGLRTLTGGISDALLFALPWRRKRMQRDFSAMLAILLDSGVPEAEAVMLASETTDNRKVRARAHEVAARLLAGNPLPEALRVMDDSGELHWRLKNAARVRASFQRSLAGWHDALDAKAFQLEQTAAQTATSALVLLNGFVVAAIVISIFIALLDIMNQAVLW